MASPEVQNYTRHASMSAQTPGPSSNAAAAAAAETVTVPMPPPQTFDFLPPLHALLSRLLLPSNGLQPPAGEGPSSSPPVDASATSPNGSSAIHTTGHLDIQELGAAAGVIKIRIQKARVAVKALPDVDLSLQEQQVEIGELEERIERMRGMLRGLSGSDAEVRDVSMSDVAG